MIESRSLFHPTSPVSPASSCALSQFISSCDAAIPLLQATVSSSRQPHPALPSPRNQRPSGLMSDTTPYPCKGSPLKSPSTSPERASFIYITATTARLSQAGDVEGGSEKCTGINSAPLSLSYLLCARAGGVGKAPAPNSSCPPCVLLF